MTDIYPYSVLSADPTSEAVICWVDDRDGADGGDQTLDHDAGSETVSGEEVPDSEGVYLYEAVVTGLEPGTEYSATIDGEEPVTWETFPDERDDDVTILITSDIHIDLEGDNGSMPSDEFMDPLAATEPDLFLLPGDVVTGGNSTSSSNTDWWLNWWSDYLPRVHEESGKLVPLYLVPGNHEVGNSTWEGTTDESVDPEAGYFQFWFKHPEELEPDGKNYGEVTIGDYLQIIGLDSHSEFATELGDWLPQNINDAEWCLPIIHSPLLAAGYRTDEDEVLQENLRNELAAPLSSADNIHALFCGHVHLRKRTTVWGVIDDEPEHDEFTELTDGSGYIVEDFGGLREFGNGYSDNYDTRPSRWYAEVSKYERQFYEVTVGDAMTITEYDEDGGEWHTSTAPIGSQWTITSEGEWTELSDSQWIIS